MTKKTHINGCKIVHKYTSAIVTVHICIVIVALLYIILILFLSPHILSSPDSFSLQLIISAIDNPHRQPHEPSTTTHITTTQHHQTLPLQPNTANHHHHHHNSDTPQNQPKIKQTHTRSHHKINQKSNTPTPTLGHTNRDRESIFVNL